MVGLGDFTVQDDARQLGEVIRKLVQRRKAVALERGDLLTWRVLHVCLPKLLRGTGADEALPPAGAARRMDGGHAIWRRRRGPPLRPHAAQVRRARRAARPRSRLIARGASVHRRIRKAVPAFELAAGDTILYGALLMRCSLPMAMLLLDAHADPAHKVRGEGNALFAAGLGGRGADRSAARPAARAVGADERARRMAHHGRALPGARACDSPPDKTCPKFLER